MKDGPMKMSARAINAPQSVNARRVEATIIEKMPADTWLTVTQTSRLIRAEESRTRARLNRLVREGKIERKRERGNQGEVYLFKKPS
jgi:predicted transcriptional regulator